MSTLNKKLQNNRLYLYNKSDNTLVNLPPALITYTAQKLKQKQRLLEQQQVVQRKVLLQKDEYNKEVNTARNVFANKYKKEQEAFNEIKKGRHYNKMDQTTLNVTNPMAGPTTTYTQTPEEEKVQRPIPGYEDPAGEVMTSLITAPFGGLILKTAATKLLTSKFGHRLLYDIAANEAFNGIYSGVTDRDFASDVNYISGLNKDNMFGDILSFSLSSAGRKTLGKALGKAATNGLYQAALHSNTMKRAAETAMRLSLANDGLYSSVETLMREDPERINNLIRYIRSGKLPDGLNKSYLGFYKGLSGDLSLLEGKVNGDLIDAYIYDTQIDPRLATYVGTTKDTVMGLSESYAKGFPGKTLKIYKTTNPEHVATTIDVPTKRTIIGNNDNIPSNIDFVQFDTAGHHVIIDPNGESIASDIWHFTPKTYSEKRLSGVSLFEGERTIPVGGINLKLKTSPESLRLEVPVGKLNIPINIDTNKLRQFGLKYINDIGHPVIINSPAEVHFVPRINPSLTYEKIVENSINTAVSSEVLKSFKEKISKLNLTDLLKTKYDNIEYKPEILKQKSDFDIDKQ